MKVIVIIPAAGLGTRMTGAGKRAAPSKQFTEIGGVSILVHTVRKFVAVPLVTELCVALRKPEMAHTEERLKKESGGKRLRVVEGGEHRQESVANALATIQAAPDDIVLVHDAVRPFVDPDIIGNVIQAAQKYGAAIAGLPAVDTVKQVERTAEGAIITSTIPRARVVMAQTPQGFRYQVIKKAFDEALADGFTGTDEASLVERSGHDVAVVMGSPRNIKITTPADMELAEIFMSRDARAKALTG